MKQNKLKAAMEVTSGQRIAEQEDKRKGKRSDPNYQAITAYLHKDTYYALKVALVQDRKEMSDVLEELAKGWLTTRK